MAQTLSKEEYLKAQGALALGFGPTTDFADPQLGSTVQSEVGIPDRADGLPGQVYGVDQLPDPRAAVAYGLPPVTVPEALIVSASDAEKHVQGKDPLDILTSELRESVGDPALAFDGTVRSADDSLTSLSDRTGPGLADSEGVDTTADGVFQNGVKGGLSSDSEVAADASGSVDPEGVQKGDGDKEPASRGGATQSKAEQAKTKAEQH